MDGHEKQAPLKRQLFLATCIPEQLGCFTAMFDVVGSVLESCVGHNVIHLVEPPSETGVLAW